jgi:hypothetical protein
MLRPGAGVLFISVPFYSLQGMCQVMFLSVFSSLQENIIFPPLPARDHAEIWERIAGDDCTQEHMPEQSKSHGNSGSVCQPQHMGTNHVTKLFTSMFVSHSV